MSLQFSTNFNVYNNVDHVLFNVALNMLNPFVI